MMLTKKSTTSSVIKFLFILTAIGFLGVETKASIIGKIDFTKNPPKVTGRISYSWPSKRLGWKYENYHGGYYWRLGPKNHIKIDFNGKFFFFYSTFCPYENLKMDYRINGKYCGETPVGDNYILPFYFKSGKNNVSISCWKGLWLKYIEVSDD